MPNKMKDEKRETVLQMFQNAQEVARKGIAVVVISQNPRLPDLQTLAEWEAQGGCESTDGCWVEPDGHCPHGCSSWLLELGLI